MKILIVEDEFLIATLAMMVLTDAGHEVIGPVANEADGLGLAHEHRPVLALLDVDLGPGGCGVALARNLHAQLGIRALFVSASHERARTARDVAFGLMSKPWEARALVHAVAACSALLAGLRPEVMPAGLELFR